MDKKADIRIVYIPIKDIKEYDNNPRKNDKAVEAVMKSINKFGVRVPAIVDKDNVLIAGHTRVKAALKLGMTEFPCVMADDLSKNQAKAFRLADNRIQEDSEWDTATLAEEFHELEKNNFDLSDTGFDEFEIEGLTAGMSIEPEDDFEDDYEPEMDDDFEEGDEEPQDVPTEEQASDSSFVCVVCCHTDEDREFVKELLRETGDLKNNYKVKQIKEMLKAAEAE